MYRDLVQGLFRAVKYYCEMANFEGYERRGDIIPPRGRVRQSTKARLRAVAEVDYVVRHKTNSMLDS